MKAGLVCNLAVVLDICTSLGLQFAASIEWQDAGSLLIGQSEKEAEQVRVTNPLAPLSNRKPSASSS